MVRGGGRGCGWDEKTEIRHQCGTFGIEKRTQPEIWLKIPRTKGLAIFENGNSTAVLLYRKCQ